MFVVGFADPDHVEVHRSGFDNIPLVEQLKIGASFRCCTGNERTPRLLAFTVHRIAVYLRIPLTPIGRVCIFAASKTQSSVPSTAYPCLLNHSTAAAASIDGHAASPPDLKAATANSDGKPGGNNSERKA